MAKKLCFVLGSGGSRGIAHIGFLQAMEENGIKPDCIAGCSMGAVVGACYAAGKSPLELKQIAENLKFNDIVDIAPNIFTKKGLLRSVKLRQKLESLIGDKTFDELSIPFECVACDVISGKTIVFSHGKVEECVRASSSIPTIFRPVEKDDMILVDGGTMMRCPICCAKDFNADVTVVVDVLGELREYEPCNNIISMVLRLVEIVDWNTTKKRYEEKDFDLLITPDLGLMSQYKVEKLKYAYDQGYTAGLENVDKIKQLIKG